MFVSVIFLVEVSTLDVEVYRIRWPLNQKQSFLFVEQQGLRINLKSISERSIYQKKMLLSTQKIFRIVINQWLPAFFLLILNGCV